METTKRLRILGILVLLSFAAAAFAEADPRDSLDPSDIESVRINLEPAGAGLGFEATIPGDDPRLVALLELIRGAQPGGGHKCPNAGAIRFRLKTGRLVGVGLLPAHTPGDYGLRLYDGERHVGTCRVERAALLGVLASLGVPTDDPAFRE
jgi:hypothetical protein